MSGQVDKWTGGWHLKGEWEVGDEWMDELTNICQCTHI